LKFIRNYSEFSWVMANNFDNSVAISERVQKKQSKFWSLKNYK
jgi:gamma-glutamylcysteine synthetase